MDSENEGHELPPVTPFPGASPPASSSGDSTLAGQESGKTEIPPAPGPRLDPVALADRIESIDVLRGVAVLGILAMNIYSFGLPNAAYSNPVAYGGFTGLNRITWIFTYVLFELKFMTIFSALFGAGVVLLHHRAEAGNRPLRGAYYRRILWLLLFGALHGYLLWEGDILFSYAFAGLFLYLFRRRSPRTLFIVGAGLLLIPALTAVGFSHYIEHLQSNAVQVEELQIAGEEPSEEQEKLMEAWDDMRSFLQPTEDDIQEEIESYQGGYLDVLRFRAPLTFMSQTMSNVFFVLWRAGAVMLIGMALMKLGVFSAQRSERFYRRCLLWGYGVGIPLLGVGAWDLMRTEFEVVHMMRYALFFNYVGSLFIALGHVSVVMLLSQSRVLLGLQRRFAAVGRTAFSNYLLDTVICTTIFYGYGLGLFGRMDRFYLMGIVVAIWVLQLWLSPWWLQRFRFGPAEWLWRSLTYWKRQPMRIAPARAPETTVPGA